MKMATHPTARSRMKARSRMLMRCFMSDGLSVDAKAEITPGYGVEHLVDDAVVHNIYGVAARYFFCEEFVLAVAGFVVGVSSVVSHDADN